MQLAPHRGKWRTGSPHERGHFGGKVTIIRDHFGAIARPVGLALLWLTALNRHLGHEIVGLIKRREGGQGEMWKTVWKQRKDWLQGY